MGRMLEALKRAETQPSSSNLSPAANAPPAEPEAAATADEVPYIEWGPHKCMEASPSVNSTIINQTGANRRGYEPTPPFWERCLCNVKRGNHPCPHIAVARSTELPLAAVADDRIWRPEQGMGIGEFRRFAVAAEVTRSINQGHHRLPQCLGARQQ